MANLDTPQLSTVEQAELTACETIIKKGLQTFIEVGSALMSIRDNQLYRATHATFEDYTLSRWGISRPRAYQLMGAAQVAENLSTIVDTPPANEAQVRSLVSLTPDDQRAAYQNAVTNSPNGKPTAAQVQAEADKFKPVKTTPARVGGYDPDTGQPNNPPAPPSTPDLAIGDKVRTRAGEEGIITAINGRLYTLDNQPRAYYAALLTVVTRAPRPEQKQPDGQPPLPPPLTRPRSEIEQILDAAGINAFKVVTHVNGKSGTYTAGFDAPTRDEAWTVARQMAERIAALGYRILEAAPDLEDETTLGRNGISTPMVRFAAADYGVPSKLTTAQGFSVLYLDPPWEFKVYSRDTGLGRSAESHYDTMCLEDLMALPMQNLMADDCAVFMWATWPTLAEALQLGAAWGLTYKTCAFNWVKLNRNQTDTPFTGMGYWTRANSEPCLLFTRGTPHRDSKSVPQILLDWEDGLFQTETIATPIGAHSEKPNAIYERIEALIPGSYCEVFARQARHGWTAIGNEIDGRSIQEVLAELERESA